MTRTDYNTDVRFQKCIELYLMGYNPTQISERVGISRETFYTWKKRKEWIKKVDEYTMFMTEQTKEKLKAKSTDYLNRLEELCNTTENDSVKYNCLTYLINRIHGTPTSKVETKVEENTQQGIDINNALAKLKEMKESQE